MKKSGILNKEISNLIASMGHTDMLTISDCGLPISYDRYRIDLSIVGGKPRFLEVLEPVLNELKIEKVIMSEEIKSVSPKMLDTILKILPNDVEIEYVPHSKFKEISNTKTKGVIRTGEMTPYANIILVSGVTY